MKLEKRSALTLLATFLIGCGGQMPAPIVTGTGYMQKTADTPVSVAPTEVAHYIPQQKQALYYTVQKGDTLWSIAQKHGKTTADIIAFNKLTSNILYINQKLIVEEGTLKTEAKTVVTSQKNTSFTNRISQKRVGRTSDKRDFKKEVKPSASLRTPLKEKELTYKSHRVRSGENLFRIGLKYSVSPFDLMAANDLKKPEDLQAGSVIRVPVIIKEDATGLTQTRKINEELARSRGFIWPAKGRVLKKFGKQENGIVNNGIKIKVHENTPIHAAETGVVVYADNGLKTYGNLILLRHKNGLITAYGHSSQNLVKRHDRVKKGEVIALAGLSGNVNSAQLHFEVRRNARAINPLKILPKK